MYRYNEPISPEDERGLFGFISCHRNCFVLFACSFFSFSFLGGLWGGGGGGGGGGGAGEEEMCNKKLNNGLGNRATEHSLCAF